MASNGQRIVVNIVGDDRSFQAALTRSNEAAQKFGKNVNSSLGGSSGVSVARNFDPLLADIQRMKAQAAGLDEQLAQMDSGLAGAGRSAGVLGTGLLSLTARAGAVGFAINAAYQASQHLSDALETTGSAAFTTEGRIKNFTGALLNADIIGAFQALRTQPKTIDDLGISVTVAANRLDALQKVADGTADKLRDQGTSADGAKGSLQSYSDIVSQAGTGNRELAQQLVDQVGSLRAAETAQNALADATARLGTVFRTAAGDAVVFKGAVDDAAGPHGPGLVDAINAALEQERGGFSKDISPEARNKALETVAAASGDLETLLKLQKQDRQRAREALAESRAVGKDREALVQALAEAKAAAIRTEQQIKAKNAATDKASDEADKANPADQWRKIIDSLQLGVSQAELTPRLNDDLARLNELKAGLERQVKAGVDVVAAQEKLVTVTGQIADKQEEIRRKAAQATQAKQFRALGLSAGGEEIVPGAKNLRQRIDSLLSQISSGDLKVASKLAGRLRAARALIIKEGDNLKKATREKIDEFIKAANGDDSSAKLTGPLTKNSVFQANKILEGLGLDANTEKLIRARVNAFNNADAFKTFKTPTTGTTSGVGFDRQLTIVVESILDGEKVGRGVKRFSEKDRVRNPRQKRGPNRNL